MPTIGARRKRKPKTPLDRTAAPPPAPEQAAPPPPDLDVLQGYGRPHRLLLKRRELAFAECMKYRMETWLAHFIADRGIPRDDCIPAIDLLPIYVEAWLKACILFPELLPRAEPEDDDDDDGHGTIADRYARREGLSVPRKRPGKHKPVPTLPGCRGVDEDGAACAGLRRYGEKFCPAHEKAERERIREATA